MQRIREDLHTAHDAHATHLGGKAGQARAIALAGHATDGRQHVQGDGAHLDAIEVEDAQFGRHVAEADDEREGPQQVAGGQRPEVLFAQHLMQPVQLPLQQLDGREEDQQEQRRHHELVQRHLDQHSSHAAQLKSRPPPSGALRAHVTFITRRVLQQLACHQEPIHLEGASG